MLDAGVTRGELIAAFVRHDVANHGLATLARGDRQRARRILTFGTACYPEVTRKRNRTRWPCGVSLPSGRSGLGWPRPPTGAGT